MSDLQFKGVPNLPLDLGYFWGRARGLSLAEKGAVVVLLTLIWQSKSHRIPASVHPFPEILRDEDDESQAFRRVIRQMFWFHSREGFIYSPYILELVGRPTARKPIPRWMKDYALEQVATSCVGITQCEYCYDEIPSEECHFDHRLPISRGGINHPQNLAVACAACNLKKSTMTEREFRDQIDAEWAAENSQSDEAE